MGIKIRKEEIEKEVVQAVNEFLYADPEKRLKPETTFMQEHSLIIDGENLEEAKRYVARKLVMPRIDIGSARCVTFQEFVNRIILFNFLRLK